MISRKQEGFYVHSSAAAVIGSSDPYLERVFQLLWGGGASRGWEKGAQGSYINSKEWGNDKKTIKFKFILLLFEQKLSNKKRFFTKTFNKIYF
jgi:hypothetical protein